LGLGATSITFRGLTAGVRRKLRRESEVLDGFLIRVGDLVGHAILLRLQSAAGFARRCGEHSGQKDFSHLYFARLHCGDEKGSNAQSKGPAVIHEAPSIDAVERIKRIGHMKPGPGWYERAGHELFAR
jgi:hypothetical protein